METEWIGFDLDGVIIRNPFEAGVEPFVRRYIAERSPRRGATNGGMPGGGTEAEALTGTAARGAQRIDDRLAVDIAAEFRRRMRADPMLAYDWDGVYRSVAAAWGVPSVPDVEGLVQRFVRDPSAIAALPGAEAALRAAREAGFKVAALTNGFARFQIPTLDALGLARFFDDVVDPEGAGVCKPSERFFAQRPGLVAHVGDTLWHDVRGAQLAGVDALWVHPAAPARVTDDAGDIAGAVRSAATRHPLRRLYSDVPVASLRPCVAGRRVDEVVELWLGRLARPSKGIRRPPAI